MTVPAVCPVQTTLTCFAKPEFSVVRQHEEFRWLHGALEENADYCGFIVSAGWPSDESGCWLVQLSLLPRWSDSQFADSQTEFISRSDTVHPLTGLFRLDIYHAIM